MRFLINALSVTNASGRHVLLGHLAELVRQSDGRHGFVVLWHAGNEDIVRDFNGSVRWRRCPDYCRHWLARTLWERGRLRQLCVRERIDAAFTPAGTAMPVGAVPQIVFCQNPWAMIPGIARTPSERVKAALQRRGYRQAVRRATAMVFNSHFMESAYIRNARGLRPARRWVAYQGVDEDTFAASAHADGKRIKGQILSVSAMARHKDVATLLHAAAILRERFQDDVHVKLVGEWPDPAYRDEMARLAVRLGLRDAVAFSGHVPRAELHRLYAESQAFALFSRCESFGIPAVEAQAFGTPVVGADCCATREIDGAGGLYVPPGDDEAAAAALHRLLSCDDTWRDLSAKARANAQRFRWSVCTAALRAAFEEIAGR